MTQKICEVRYIGSERILFFDEELISPVIKNHCLITMNVCQEECPYDSNLKLSIRKNDNQFESKLVVRSKTHSFTVYEKSDDLKLLLDQNLKALRAEILAYRKNLAKNALKKKSAEDSISFSGPY